MWITMKWLEISFFNLVILCVRGFCFASMQFEIGLYAYNFIIEINSYYLLDFSWYQKRNYNSPTQTPIHKMKKERQKSKNTTIRYLDQSHLRYTKKNFLFQNFSLLIFMLSTYCFYMIIYCYFHLQYQGYFF